MLDLIYALGVGFSFSIGVGFGALLCRHASKSALKNDSDEWKMHREQVEYRLELQAANTERMADALDKIART